MTTNPAPTTDPVPLDSEEVLDKYKRALADLDNLSKRQRRELDLARTEGEEKVLRQVVELTDDFQRMLVAIAQADGENAKEEVLSGVKMIFEKFQHTLRTLEVEGFATVGQRFSAELMEAIGQIPSKALPPGTVETQLSTGFTRRGKLLKPAQVVVTVAEKEDGDGL